MEEEEVSVGLPQAEVFLPSPLAPHPRTHHPHHRQGTYSRAHREAIRHRELSIGQVLAIHPPATAPEAHPVVQLRRLPA